MKKTLTMAALALTLALPSFAATATTTKGAAATTTTTTTTTSGQYMPDKRQYSDTDLYTKVRETLTAEPFKENFSTLNFDVYNGVVTIKGTTESQDTKTKIQEAIKAIPGVTNVNNQINVSGKTVDTSKNTTTPASKTYK